MDSVAAEIEQKNQETFPEPAKKPRKPRSDAGQKRGPHKPIGGVSVQAPLAKKKSAKKAAKKAAKKSQKKSVLFVQPGDVIRPHFSGSVNDIHRVVDNSLDEARELGILGDETPWRDFGRSLSALCRHISRRTGIREAGRRFAGAFRMIWRGDE